MFRWGRAGAESLRSRRLEGLDFWDQELWKNQFLCWGREVAGATPDGGSWGMDSWVRECLVPLGDPGGGRLAGKIALSALDTSAPGRGRVPPLPPPPSPHLRRAGARTGQAPDGELRAQEQQQQWQQQRQWRRGPAAAQTGNGGAYVPHVWALTPSRPQHSRPARPGPSGDRSSQRHSHLLLPPLGCAGASSPAPRRSAFLARTIACPLCAGRSCSPTPRGSLRQGPFRFQMFHPMPGSSQRSGSWNLGLWVLCSSADSKSASFSSRNYQLERQHPPPIPSPISFLELPGM